MALSDTEIYDLTLKCEKDLGELQGVFVSKNNIEHSRIVRRHQRSFEQWAGYLGVFATPSASLDHRLRNSPQTRDSVVRLLHVLERNVRYCLKFEYAIGDSNLESDTSTSSQIEVMDEEPRAMPVIVKVALDGIEGAMRWLDHLGLAIRETSKSTVRARVKRFTDKRAESSALLEHLTLLAVRGLYPQISDSFAIQLADSVSFRRQRLEYSREHGRKLGARRESEQDVEAGPEPDEDHRRSIQTPSHSKKVSHGQIHLGPSHASSRSETEHSEHKEENKLLSNAGLQSRRGPRTTTSLNPSDMYPRTPEVRQSENEEPDLDVQCEWCRKKVSLPEDLTERRRIWRDHFTEDLEPYVCISEDCSAQPVYFSSRRSWSEHMNSTHTDDWAQDIHKPAIWYCDIDPHQYEEFRDEGDLRDHLKKEHETTLTREDVDTVVIRNKMFVSRPPTECPLCCENILGVIPSGKPIPPQGTEAGRIIEASSVETVHHHELQNRENMVKHIGKHLKSLAFLSLRYIYDATTGREDSPKSSKGARGSEAWTGSSQDQNNDHYFELEGSLNFEYETENFDAGDTALDDDFESRNHLEVKSPFPSEPRQRSDFKIAIICALTLESDAVQDVFDKRWDEVTYGKMPGDTNQYTTGVIGCHNVVVVHMPGMGKSYGASVAANCRASFSNLGLVLVVGICGGVPFTKSGAEIVLGDIVVSDGLIQYDFGRQFPDRFVRKNDTIARPNSEILSFLAKMKGRWGMKKLRERTAIHLERLRDATELGAIANYPGACRDTLYEPTYRHKHQAASTCEVCSSCDTKNDPVCEAALTLDCESLQCGDSHLVARQRLVVLADENKNQEAKTGPFIHFGLYASGDKVMKSGEEREIIAEKEGVVAFEMEGSGVWEGFPGRCLVVKAVCDYADSHKNKRWQTYAAASAAACTKALLESWSP